MISSTADAPTSTNHHKSPLSPLIGLRLKRRQLPNLKPPSNDTEASSPSPTAPLSPVATSPTGEGESCRQFLLRRHAVEQVWSGPAPEDVPRLALGDIRPDIFASQTGPDSGHMLIHELKKERGETVGSVVAGSGNWKAKSRKAFGLSISLYERHPFSKRKAGEPIADSFGVLAGTNCACLAIADGVNWGQKARLASRCAIHAVMTYVHKRIFSRSPKAGEKAVRSTRDALQVLLEAFSVAQATILRFGGGLTTLATALVLPLAPEDGKETRPQFAVCVVNLGDSLAYLLSNHHGLREITVGSHDVETARNIRDAGGALGPVHGGEPELNNLTCSLTISDAGDIVFLTSDGVSDNFDPVITKLAQPTCPVLNGDHFPSADDVEDTYGPLHLSPPERHSYAMKAMEKVLHEYELEQQTEPCAESLCETLVRAAYLGSAAKRSVLEDPGLYETAEKRQTAEERSRLHAALSEKLATCPGKLDHATCVAFEIGVYRGNEREHYDLATYEDALVSSQEGDEPRNHTSSSFSYPSTPNAIRNLFRRKTHAN